MRTLRLRCGTHGETRWSGQVICNACGKVWHLGVKAQEPPTKDGTCTCGKDLTGDKGSARAICADCYRGKRAAQAHAPN